MDWGHLNGGFGGFSECFFSFFFYLISVSLQKISTRLFRFVNPCDTDTQSTRYDFCKGVFGVLTATSTTTRGPRHGTRIVNFFHIAIIVYHINFENMLKPYIQYYIKIEK